MAIGDKTAKCHELYSRAINSYVETAKHIIKKDLFLHLNISSTSRYTMSDVFNLSFSTHCRRPSAIATATLSNREDQENATQFWPWEEKGGR